MRRTLIIFAVSGMLASATACGGGNAAATSAPSTASAAPAGQTATPRSGRTYQVRLEILGKGRLNGVYYHVDTDGRAANIALPWKKTQTVHGGVQVAVLASTAAGQQVTCRIIVNGKVAAKETGEVAQCRYPLPK